MLLARILVSGHLLGLVTGNTKHAQNCPGIKPDIARERFGQEDSPGARKCAPLTTANQTLNAKYGYRLLQNAKKQSCDGARELTAPGLRD